MARVGRVIGIALLMRVYHVLENDKVEALSLYLQPTVSSTKWPVEGERVEVGVKEVVTGFPWF